MRQVISDHYVNKFRTYLSFSQRVLHSVLRSKEKKISNTTTQCTKETFISMKNNGKVKEKQITSKKENCFRIATSEIRAQIYQIIVSWRYCQCVGRCRDYNRSRPFLHLISDFFNEKKAKYKIPLKPKAPFKWVFMDIIPATAPKILTSDTTFF